MYQNSVKSCMIIGGGKSSYYLAKQLIEQKMEVKIIESNKARCDELSTLLPEALVICGDGGDEELLKEEGIGSAEAFVPLTGLDEENILLTLFAETRAGAENHYQNQPHHVQRRDRRVGIGQRHLSEVYHLRGDHRLCARPPELHRQQRGDAVSSV
ncbi:MAG: NAD-binding protein [Christensenellales bacterium]